MCMLFRIKFVDHAAIYSRTFDLASAFKLAEKFLAAQTSDLDHNYHHSFIGQTETRHLDCSKGWRVLGSFIIALLLILTIAQLNPNRANKLYFSINRLNSIRILSAVALPPIL